MTKLYTQIGGGKSEYLAPELNILDIRVEAGFAKSSSGTNEGMDEDEEANPW